MSSFIDFPVIWGFSRKFIFVRTFNYLDQTDP